jgi:hypothetical protein
VNDLGISINQNILSKQAAGEAFGKVEYATQQLGSILVGADPAGRVKSALRLCDALDDQTEVLRDLAAERLGNAYTPEMDLNIRAFARAARKLGRFIRDTGDLDRAKAEFNAFQAAGWQNIAGRMMQVPNLPGEVRGQATRVEGIARRLGHVLGGVEIGPGPNPQSNSIIAVGAGDGGGPRVRVYHNLQRRPLADFFAYDPSFRGGVRVAVADLNGDGVPDIVTAPGPGMRPLIRVFDGRDVSLLVEFYALDPNWQGGVNIAAADLTKTGQAIIAVAPDVGGGPQVQVFDLAQGKEIDSFFAFPNALRGGVRMAWGDVNGDGTPDLVCAQGPCDHPPEVKVFDGKNRKILSQFVALDPRWRGGLYVACADLQKDGRAEVIVGTDTGGTPLVRVFDPVKNKMEAEWLAYPDMFRRDVDGDGRLDVLCVPGAGLKDSPLVVFSGANRKPLATIPTFLGFEGGGFLGAR